MKPTLFVRVGIALALSVSWLYPSRAEVALSCKPSEIASAFKAHDAQKLASLYAAADKLQCSSIANFCVGRLIAILLVTTQNENLNTNDAKAVIDKATSYGSPWQVLSARGDLAFEEGQQGGREAYSRAAQSYERAFDDLAEQPACVDFGEPGAPPKSEIADLHKRMTEAKLLAPTFEVVRTRAGECGGVFLKDVRGFEPQSAPLPIAFEFNSSNLTPTGEKALQGLIECLGTRKFSSIRLTGHTDHVGSDNFNMTLSAQRLDKIKALIQKSEFHGKIELEPKGKREPFVPDDAGKYTQADIDQMNRRVELKDASE